MDVPRPCSHTPGPFALIQWLRIGISCLCDPLLQQVPGFGIMSLCLFQLCEGNVAAEELLASSRVCRWRGAGRLLPAGCSSPGHPAAALLRPWHGQPWKPLHEEGLLSSLLVSIYLREGGKHKEKARQQSGWDCSHLLQLLVHCTEVTLVVRRNLFGIAQGPAHELHSLENHCTKHRSRNTGQSFSAGDVSKLPAFVWPEVKASSRE